MAQILQWLPEHIDGRALSRLLCLFDGMKDVKALPINADSGEFGIRIRRVGGILHGIAFMVSVTGCFSSSRRPWFYRI